MKKNKNIFGIIMIAVFLTVIVSVSPIKSVIKRVLNDISGATDNHVYLTASFKYLDNEDKEVENVDDVIYVFLCQNEDFTSGNRVTIKLQANNGEQKVTKIYNQNGGSDINGDISGEYYVKVAVPKNGRKTTGVKENEKFEANDYDEYKNNDSYNGSYIITFSDKVEIKENDELNLNSSSEKKLEIIVKERDGERLISSDILKPMDLETNFGVFAHLFEAGPDIESTIAVEIAKKIENNFGLSENNYKGLKNSKVKGKISINKLYLKNDNIPVVKEKVKIGLTKVGDNALVQQKECTTNNEGKCSVIFEDLDKGSYNIFEELNEKKIVSSTSVVNDEKEKFDVSFSDTTITISEFSDDAKTDYNYNYVGKAEDNVEKVDLTKMRGPGTLVVEDENLYNKYKDKNEFNKSDGKIEFFKVGMNNYNKIDFDTEFQNLNELSTLLSKAIDSEDVKVYYTNHEKIKPADINFNSYNKEYILVNVDCSNASEVTIEGRHKRDGVLLYNDNHEKNGENGLDYSFVYNEGAKIIYNFYVKQNDVISPYTGNIKLDGQSTGILLAPSAIVNGANGNHAGTIIAKEYYHTQGEVHQRVKPKWIDTDTPAATITNKLIEEEKKEQDVSIGKVDANNNPIVGAELQLLDKDNNVIESWTSDNNLHKVTQKLTSGEPYTVHEVKAPTGYQKAKDYTFTYDEKTITYYMTDTKVIVSKFDENQSYLPGATLQILDKDDKVIEEWVTDGKQHYVNYQLEVGETYTLHEEKAPEGYKKAEDVKFVYESNDKDQTVEMKDQKIVIGVFVEKKNMNDELLSGAHLQVLDSNGTILDDWISDGTVHRVNTELEIGGKYTLHEEEAPEGYELSPDVSFEVKNTEDNQIVTMVDNKIIIPGEPYVKIRKEDKDGKLLEGAELQLLDSEGNVIEEWTSNDKEHIVDTKLEVGKQYTLHEKTAPRGYEKAEDITFVAQENEQEVKMIDKRIKKVAGVVETLDKITKYVTIFAITLSLLLLGLYTYRKLNKRYTE